MEKYSNISRRKISEWDRWGHLMREFRRNIDLMYERSLDPEISDAVSKAYEERSIEMDEIYDLLDEGRLGDAYDKIKEGDFHESLPRELWGILEESSGEYM